MSKQSRKQPAKQSAGERKLFKALDDIQRSVEGLRGDYVRLSANLELVRAAQVEHGRLLADLHRVVVDLGSNAKTRSRQDHLGNNGPTAGDEG